MKYRWIKSADRKPKHGQLCLVFCKTADRKLPFRMCAFWNKRTNRWDLIIEWWSKRITHWTPFPRTPK